MSDTDKPSLEELARDCTVRVHFKFGASCNPKTARFMTTESHILSALESAVEEDRKWHKILQDEIYAGYCDVMQGDEVPKDEIKPHDALAQIMHHHADACGEIVRLDERWDSARERIAELERELEQNRKCRKAEVDGLSLAVKRVEKQNRELREALEGLKDRPADFVSCRHAYLKMYAVHEVVDSVLTDTADDSGNG